MKLKQRLVTNEGEFELIVMKREELKNHTTSHILEEATRRGYLEPTKNQAYSIGHILDRNVANDVVGTWILVAIYKNDDDPFFKNGATIVSGILNGQEGSSIPDYGKRPYHKWETGIDFVFLSPVAPIIP